MGKSIKIGLIVFLLVIGSLAIFLSIIRSKPKEIFSDKLRFLGGNIYQIASQTKEEKNFSPFLDNRQNQTEREAQKEVPKTKETKKEPEKTTKDNLSLKPQTGLEKRNTDNNSPKTKRDFRERAKLQKREKPKKEETEKQSQPDKKEEKQKEENNKESQNQKTLAKILISEVCSGFNSSQNEFIEIYNPNDFPLVLDDNNFSLILVDSKNKATDKKIDWQKSTLPQKGYFLFVGGNLAVGSKKIKPDAIYSSQLTSTSGVILKDGAGDILDKVSWGSQKNPPPKSATERKGIILENGLKTNESLVRIFSFDSDDNSKDFLLNPAPSPENSLGERLLYQKEKESSKDSSQGLSLEDSSVGQETKNLKILITEIQIEGERASNDFIELYNPNQERVDISGWQIKKRNKNGKESSIVLLKEGSVIAPKGYFLWANSKEDFSESIGADASTTSYLSSNNSIALFDKDKNLIDALSFGTSTNPFLEGLSFLENPKKGKSLARRVQNDDYIDTDNNSFDFEIQRPTPKAKNINLKKEEKSQEKPNLVISEVQIKKEEFVEIFNQGEERVSLANLYLAYFSSKRDWNNPYRVWPLDQGLEIKPYSHFLIGIFVPEGSQASFDWQVSSSDGSAYKREQISDNGAIGVFFCDPKIQETAKDAFECKIDLLGWGNSKVFEEKSAEIPEEGKSLSRKISQE
jgi:hypothetical protein